MQPASAVALMPLLVFAAYTAAVTLNAFQRPDNPLELPLPFTRSGPHVIHDSLGTPKSASKIEILISSVVFEGFLNVICRQTDRQTDK